MISCYIESYHITIDYIELYHVIIYPFITGPGSSWIPKRETLFREDSPAQGPSPQLWNSAPAPTADPHFVGRGDFYGGTQSHLELKFRYVSPRLDDVKKNVLPLEVSPLRITCQSVGVSSQMPTTCCILLLSEPVGFEQGPRALWPRSLLLLI